MQNKRLRMVCWRLLLALVGAFVCSDATLLLGKKECTFGPAYWCNSLKNAKECSAVTHCIQAVWENQVLPEDNDDVCTICKDMVQQARDTLESNETQELLRQVLEGSCRLIPLKEIADECIKLADGFIPELIETLASQMNPQVVCATVGLCNNVRIDRLLAQHAMTLPAMPHVRSPAVSQASHKDQCDDCKVFVQDFVNYVQQHPKDELMNHMLAICGQLGSISDGCSALVEVNINEIYDFITNRLKQADMCTLFGMCPGIYGDKLVVATHKYGDTTCDFCIAIAQHWRDVLTSNTTEEEFKEILNGLCDHSGSFKDECRSLVDRYYIQFYNLLMKEFNPKEICEAVGLCASLQFQQKLLWSFLYTGKHDPMSKIYPSMRNLKFVGTDEAPSYAYDKAREHSGDVLPRVELVGPSKVSVTNIGDRGIIPIADDRTHVKNDDVCAMCQFTMHFIQDTLQEKGTREDIKNAVKNVCEKLPKTVKEECDDYVDAYGDQVISLLIQELDPDLICPMLNLCPSKLLVHNAIGTQDEVTCVACEFIVLKLQELLKNNNTDAAIEHAFNQLCEHMPSSMTQQCHQFVADSAIEVIKFLTSGISAYQICSLLHYCPSHTTKLANNLDQMDSSNQLPLSRMFVPQPLSDPAPSVIKGQSKMCILCEFAIRMIEDMILSNSSHIEKDIKEAVEFVCIHLPGTVREDCVSFIEQYGDALIEMLINKVQPDVACQELHVCAPPSFEGLFAARAKLEPSSPDAGPCAVCKQLVQTVAAGIRAEAGQAQATEFCASMQQPAANMCKNIVDRYLGIIPLLLRGMNGDAEAVCTSIHSCPETVEKAPPLLGAKECTWGPAYWCDSRENARKCGTESHCEENKQGYASEANAIGTEN